MLRQGRVRHVKGYGTGWGGYVLLEVDDAAAFARYQLFHNQNYAHVAHIAFESLFDSDAGIGAEGKRDQAIIEGRGPVRYVPIRANANKWRKP